MREHLYQGKRLDNGEWVGGNLIHRTIYYGDPVDDYFIMEVGDFDYDYYDAYEVDSETVSEFTGLTDKNGKRIFEGHIVLAKVGLHTYMGIVKYDEKCAMFVVEAFGSYKYKTEHTDKLCFSCEYITEVIGNKWDNPELLEGGEE